MSTKHPTFVLLSVLGVASVVASVVVSVVVWGVAVAGCSAAHSESAHVVANPDPPVRVVTVPRESLSQPIRAVGRLAYKRSLALSFKNGGTLRQLLIAEGAQVRKGQRLALVDTTEIDAQVEQARAAVAKADRDSARVVQLHAGAAAAKNDVDN